MNARERVLAILNRQPVDRIPVDIWYTPEIGAALRKYCNADNDIQMFKRLGVDKMVGFGVIYPTPPDRTLWGSTLKPQQAGDAHYSEIDTPGLTGYDTLQALKDYPYWPDPDKYDYEAMLALVKQHCADFVVYGPWVSFFEIYCQMRGLEQAMIDIAMAPDYVQAALDKIEAIQTQMMTRFFDKAAKYLSAAFLSDDMGSQTNLMLSLNTWDMFFKDRLRRWCQLSHSYGLKVVYHSDGAISALIPRLIEAGIDILNPIQHVCPGMDRATLKQHYGDKLIFHGGVENQSILPFGTPEQVRQETLECLRTLGAGKQGYICCSCHNIQPGTPVENILTMIRTVQEYSNGC